MLPLHLSQVTELYNEKPEVDTSNFKTVLYEGNGGSQYISNVGFEPDLVWIKERTGSAWHILTDSVRGANKTIYSNDTYQEESLTNVMNSFESNGFTVGYNSAYSSVFSNKNNEDYVAWTWKGGGDAVSNTNGSITSQVSANTDAGFSIVKFTTSGGSGTVGHGLSPTIPEVVLMKRTNTTSDWYFFTTLIDGSMDLLRLNTTADKSDDSTQAFTSTTFKDWASSGNFIAYCFHSVSGYSKIGTYEGDGSTDNKIYTTDDGTSTGSYGFKPSFVMLKNADRSNCRWIIMDTARDPVNTAYHVLSASSSAAEDTSQSYWLMDFESDGFRLKYGADNEFNKSGDTFIYMAFK
jgi:hypothetical protein